MSDTEQVGLPPEESLRRHVLAPLETAESVLDQEYEELDAERRAFEAFRGRVAGIEIITTASAVPATRSPLAENRSRAPERVRSAYRETVMSVDHYEQMYGESLVENVAAELSDEIAAGLRRGAHLQFTPLFKRTLLTAVDSAIDQRESFCTILAGERDSLARSRDGLQAILDELDGTRVPTSTETDFTDALDEIASQRQETFAGRTASPRTNGHDLCAYLYTDCPWTYPVLTAVTRLRGAVNGVTAR
jgi:hypothetical protein